MLHAYRQAIGAVLTTSLGGTSPDVRLQNAVRSAMGYMAALRRGEDEGGGGGLEGGGQGEGAASEQMGYTFMRGTAFY